MKTCTRKMTDLVTIRFDGGDQACGYATEVEPATLSCR
jgi:hypothetical protein